MPCRSMPCRSTSCRQPSFVTPLADLAETVAQTIRADPGERVRRLKLIAGTTAAVVFIGWATGGMGAQIASESATPPALRYQALAPASAPKPAPASSSPLANAMQQIESNLGALFNGRY